MSANVAVVLCTRDRAKRLAPALDALELAIANAPHVSVEIILVDSASTDATLATLTSWAMGRAGWAEVLRCDRPGVCLAKNAGFRASTAPIIVTTDDDCIVDASFFSNLAIAIPDPSVAMIVGGRIDLGDPEDLPITIKPDNEPQRFRGKRMPTGFIMGANLAITRPAFEKIGYFDEDFGPGAKFLAAEDTDYITRAMLADIPITYDPRFRVSHFHGRRSIEAGRRLYTSYSYGDGAIWGKYLFRHPFVLRSMVFCLKSIAKDLVRPGRDELLGRYKAWWRLKRQLAGFFAFVTGRGNGINQSSPRSSLSQPDASTVMPLLHSKPFVNAVHSDYKRSA